MPVTKKTQACAEDQLGTYDHQHELWLPMITSHPQHSKQQKSAILWNIVSQTLPNYFRCSPLGWHISSGNTSLGGAESSLELLPPMWRETQISGFPEACEWRDLVMGALSAPWRWQGLLKDWPYKHPSFWASLPGYCFFLGCLSTTKWGRWRRTWTRDASGKVLGTSLYHSPLEPPKWCHLVGSWEVWWLGYCFTGSPKLH